MRLIIDQLLVTGFIFHVYMAAEGFIAISAWCAGKEGI